MKYPALRTDNEGFDKKVRMNISLFTMLMIIPSCYLAYSLLQEKKFSQNIEQFIQTEFVQKGYTIIYKIVNYKSKPKAVELAFLSKKIDSVALKRLNEDLSLFGLKNTDLKKSDKTMLI